MVADIAAGRPASLSAYGIGGEHSPVTYNTYQEEEITLVYKRGEEYFASEGSPVEGLIEGKKGLGVAIDMIGTLQLPVHTALSEGFLTTVDLTKTITIELRFMDKTFSHVFMLIFSKLISLSNHKTPAALTT